MLRARLNLYHLKTAYLVISIGRWRIFSDCIDLFWSDDCKWISFEGVKQKNKPTKTFWLKAYVFNSIENTVRHDSLNISIWKWNQRLFSMGNHVEMQQNFRKLQVLKLNLSAITWVKHICNEKWQCFLSCIVNYPYPGKNVRNLAVCSRQHERNHLQQVPEALDIVAIQNYSEP